MACSKCKEKKLVMKESKKQFVSTDTWGTLFVIIGLALAIYGLISLIKDVASLL